ncbi:MAG: DUF1217 domain-containing protein [Pseudomonadota bacterium]
MTFQPVVPIGGFAGWSFLQRTIDTQREAHDASPVLQRDVDYFQERIGSVLTAEALVADRRLMTVALGAFGLDDDINSKAFIQKVLESPEGDREALANRLTDRRYREMASAFGFGEAVPQTITSGFGEEIAAQFLERQFEIGVGEANEDMRLALEFSRAVPELIGRGLEDDTAWFSMMGNPPMRRVFETALGLPSSFGTLELDRQLGEFKDRMSRVFGVSEFADLNDPKLQEDMIRRFLVLSEINVANAQLSSGNIALTLLQQSAVPSQTLF